MIRRTLRALPAAIAALLCLTATGGAYLVNVTDGGDERLWDLATPAPNVVDGRLTFYIDDGGVPDIGGGSFTTAVREAIGAWEAVEHSSISFTEDGTRPATKRNASDKINWIGFQDGEIPSFTYAVAFRKFKKTRVVDADIVFNPSVRLGSGERAPWSVATPGVPDTADVRAVATHEWGHCLGFDHVPLGASTMYYALPAGATMFRSLEPDDRAMVSHAYPAASAAAETGVLEGRVDVAGTSNDRGVQVVAVDLSTGRPAAGTISRSDGRWRMEGLEQGVYRVFASPMGRTRVRAGTFSPHWTSSVTGFVPVVLEETPGVMSVLPLGAGETLSDLDLTVATGGDAHEPNDSAGQETMMGVGGGTAGSIGYDGDLDRYSFTASAGDVVSLHVHAGQIGSMLDPRLVLLRPNGSVLAANSDIRTGPQSLDEDGFDFDARLVDVTLPSTGTYTVIVSADTGVVFDAQDDPEDWFYVLSLMPTGSGAHPFTTSLVTDPAVVDGDGLSTITATLRPRTLTGSDVGPGASVVFTLSPDADLDGTPGETTDEGDGTYTVSITSPVGPGTDVLEATVDGTPTGTATLSWRGPVDGTASDFTLAPRRVRPGGESMVELLPRDANGLELGPGRTVEFSVTGDPEASADGTGDGADGTYGTVISAGDLTGTLSVSATVDASPLGAALDLGVGFPLEEVVDDALLDLEDDLDADPERKVGKRLSKAFTFLAAVDPLASPQDDLTILSALRKALAQIEKAVKNGSPRDPLALELAEAVRQAAAEALAAADELALEGRDAKSREKAAILFDKGEALLVDGRAAKAAGKYLSARKRLASLLP